MKRILLAVVLASSLVNAQAQVRAYWVDAFHPGIKTPDQVVADAVRSGANTLFVQVRPRANSCFLNTLEPVAVELGCSATFDGLADLIRKGRAQGLEIHAWMNAFTVWPSSGSPPADPRHIFNLHGLSTSGRANWLSVNNTGAPVNEGSYFLDPGHPDAAAYNADIYQQMAETYAVDGIHFDYIRYTGNTAGYNPASVERFNVLKSRTGTPSPTDPEWQQFRRAQVSALVRKVYLRSIAKRPAIKISAALIAFGAGPKSDADYLLTDTYRQVFQDWRAWMQEGILDLGVAMNYLREHNPTHAGWFDDWIAFEKDRQGRRSLSTGVAIYLNTIENTLKQVDRVLQPSPSGNRLAGFSLYSYATTNCDPGSNAGCPNLPTAQFYDAMQQKFPTPAPVPAMPWKTAPTRGHIVGQLKMAGLDNTLLTDGITVTARSADGAVLTAESDATGWYGLVDVEPGEYMVSYSRGGQAGVLANPAVVSSGQVTTVPATTLSFATNGPSLTAGEVTDALSFRTGPIAPGQLLSLFGTSLGGVAPVSASSLPLPPRLGDTIVLVNGRPAPLLYLSERQINLQAPFDLTGSTATLTVSVNGWPRASRSRYSAPESSYRPVSSWPSVILGESVAIQVGR